MPTRVLLRLALLLPLLMTVAGRADDGPILADASKAERLTLDRLSGAAAWPRRAIAVTRLERFGCGASRERLVAFLDDPAWQVRNYAIHTLARRREAAAGWFEEEQHPRVVRTALRHRYPIDVTRLERGVRELARSTLTDERMLAAEIGAASGDETLRELARDVTRKIILRMDRAEAGGLSPRLALLAGAPALHRPHLWQQWLMKSGRSFEVRPAYAVGPGPERPALSPIAALDPDRFAALETYIETLGARALDLAICLDCTASMSGELAAAQGGIDDLLRFLGDVVAGVRVALVAYRDRHDRFKTRGWDFTDDLAEARSRLWSLTAEGGGDSREAVFDAMKLAYTELAWNPEHRGVLVLVGDAPPHVGYGTQCAGMAERAAEAGVVTHAIQAEPDEDVPHFAAIAEAGGGRCVSLPEDDGLILEIAGLTLGDAFTEEFRAFFEAYRLLCR